MKGWGTRRQDWPTDLSPSQKWYERGESYGTWWGLVLLQYLTSGRGNQYCSLRQPTILPICFNLHSQVWPTLLRDHFVSFLARLVSICLKFANFSSTAFSSLTYFLYLSSLASFFIISIEIFTTIFICTLISMEESKKNFGDARGTLEGR